MKRVLLLAYTLLAVVTSWSQSDPVVMTINGVAVPRSEFEYSYNKNNGDGVIDKKNIDEYTDLFIIYKLKVAAALDAKLDTMASFKEEYTTYRNQQVTPTMVSDDEVLNEAHRIYDRTKEMIGPRGLVKPAHIVLELDTKASAQEQDKAKQRIDSIYQALKSGADFSTLAKQLSQDAGSAQNGGDLPWIMPGQTFKEFEDVIYNLQKGEISQPFLTPVGYHIVLMKDKKQLEPFDSLKSTIVRQLEFRGIRDEILKARLNHIVEQSQGTITSAEVIDKRSDSLATVNEEMKYLFKEYHDGLLLYEISNREVWEKASSDEGALQAWFKNHRKDYTWDQPRYKGIAYHVKTKQDIKAVKNCVKRLPFDQWAEVLRSTFNPDSIIRIRVEKGLFKPGDNGTIDRMVFKMTPVSEVRDASLNDYPIDAVFGKKLKRPDDYNDVRQQVIEDYQAYLEQTWVASLRKRYPVEINQEVLKTVNKH